MTEMLHVDFILIYSNPWKCFSISLVKQPEKMTQMTESWKILTSIYELNLLITKGKKTELSEALHFQSLLTGLCYRPVAGSRT